MNSQITDFAFGAKCSWASSRLPSASIPIPPPAWRRKSRRDGHGLVDIDELIQGEEDMAEVGEIKPARDVQLAGIRLPAEREQKRPLGRPRRPGEALRAVPDERVVQQRERLGGDGGPRAAAAA